VSVSGVNTSADALFSALTSQQTQMSSLAQNALSQGADMYSNGDLNGAAQSFKRAIAYDPSPDNVTQAYNLLATVYIQQNNTTDAIKAYKASISMAPSDDTAHISLGNIYFSQGLYTDAEKEYKAAVSINPTSSTDLYSLGQAYLAEGRYQDAENVFNRVIQMDPSQYGSYYALGQTYSKEGRSKEAVAEFNKTISLKPDFYNAYIDLGSSYADLGQFDKAQEQLNILNQNAPNLAPVLSSYIDKVTKPKIVAGYSSNGFLDTLGPATPVSAMGTSLSTPNASQEFEMVFLFSKPMEASSVQNPYNWSISKASSGSPGGAYNWGVPNSPTDVQVSPIPISVVYSPDSLTATVSFLVTQNATATGTIDPSHIDFNFGGVDAYGNAMDPSADEYSGISKIV